MLHREMEMDCQTVFDNLDIIRLLLLAERQSVSYLQQYVLCSLLQVSNWNNYRHEGHESLNVSVIQATVTC